MFNRSFTRAAALAVALALPMTAPAATLNYAGTTPALTFDPHATNDFVTAALARQTYETLVELGPGMELKPGLATAWEYMGDATWRLTIREGVTFHDGTPMMAEDVAFSIMRQATSKLYSSMFGRVTDAVVVDATTVDMITETPDAVMPAKLTRLFVMSEAWAAENGVTEIPQLGSETAEAYSLRHANGTGPMMLEEQVPGETTTFVKNENWWGEFTGNVDRAVYTAIGSDPTRLAALLSGEVDLITNLPLQDIERVTGAEGFKIEETPQRLFMELEMDGTRDVALATFDKDGNPLDANPFKDVRVRKAIRMAIDQNAIIERIMRGHASAVSLPGAPGFYGYTPEMEQPVTVDVEGAKELLAEAGYPDGFRTTLNCPLERYVNAEEICRASAQLLARIGIDVTVNGMVWPEFARMLVNGPDSSFHLIGAAGNSGDLQDTLIAIAYTRGDGMGANNWALFSSPELDAVVDELSVTFDEDRRAELYAEAIKLTQDEVHAVYLHQPAITWAMKDNIDIYVRADTAVQLSDVTIDE